MVADRKKDLVKLQNGEYISLGKIESVLKNHALVDNACIYGDSTRNYCIGLIVPQRENVTKLAMENNILTETFEQLCDDKTVIGLVFRELENYCKQGKCVILYILSLNLILLI